MAQETQNEVKATEVKNTQPSKKPWQTPSSSALGLILMALVFFSLLCAAFMLGKNVGDDRGQFDRMGDRIMTRGGYGDDMRGGMQGGARAGGAGPRGGMRGDVNSATSTRVMGVVTAVDGNTATVSGNGTSTKVIMNDNTVYKGDDKPAVVNDTIMAVGARDSSNNLIASSVFLTRQ